MCTMNTTIFIKGNYVGTLSSQTDTSVYSFLILISWYTYSCLLSKLVHWDWNKTSVSSCLLLIDLLPLMDGWLRCCTNSGFFPSKFCDLQGLKHFMSLDKEHTNVFTLQVFRSSSRHCKSQTFSRVEWNLSRFCQLINNLPWENLQNKRN